MATLPQLRQPANIRESGVWDSGHRLQTSTYYPSQAPAPDTSHMYIKDNTGYQRRMFSQPPGYIAPPPYNSPHRSTTVMHHCDTSWEQEGKRQTYWSQPTLRADVSVDLQYKRKVEKEDFTKPDGSKTCAELDGVKHRRQQTDVLQTISPISVNTTIQDESFSLQQPQVIKAAHNTNDQTSSKIIEGRKFKLNKKTGGMTIFCLVSRIAGITETPSLPICISQAEIQKIDLGDVLKDLQENNDNQITHADEVDFRVPILTEQSNTPDVTNDKAKQKEMLGDILSNKEETGNVSPEKKNLYVNSTLGKESKQPVSVKYPLWREPCFTSRPETGSSASFSYKVQSEDSESDIPPNKEGGTKSHPVRRPDIKTDTESEESKGLLVIDTSCVVVKMELIPSPKKEHVHYSDYTAQTEHNALDIQSTTFPEANKQVEATDQNTEKKSLHINDKPGTDQACHSDPTEERATKNESEISSLCMLTSSASETLEERAQRILGIPLYDCVTEQQPGDATSTIPDTRVAELDGGVKPSPTSLHDAVGQISEGTTEEEQLHNQLEIDQTEDAVGLKESDDEVASEDGEDVAVSQEQPYMSKENDVDSQLETEMPEETQMTEDKQFESGSGDDKTKKSLEENHPVENDSSCQHFSSPEDLSNSTVLSHSDLLSYISESKTEGGLNHEMAVLDTAQILDPYAEISPLRVPYALLENLPSPLLPESIGSSIDPTSHTDHSPSPPPPPPLPYSIDQDIEATLAITSCTENQDELLQIIENENDSNLEDLVKDTTVEQQSEDDQTDDAACVEDCNVIAEQQTEELDPGHLLEQTIEIHKNNEILQLQLKCVKTEDVFCVEQCSMTETQMQREDKSPVHFLEMTTNQDNMTDSQINTQEHLHNDKDGDASRVESYVTEEQPEDNPVGPLKQEIDWEVSQSPLDVLSHSELPSPPHMSHQSASEPVSLLEMDYFCPSALNPTSDNEIPETVPTVHLDCIEAFLPSSPSYSLSDLSSSCAAPLLEEGQSISLDLLDKDEPQYPMSLWDAVNRIRKHTAPDSENEEEDVSELWDPESLGEDLVCPGVATDRNSRKMVFDEAGQQEVEEAEESTVGVEVGQIQQNACDEEQSGHVEEDTLSCTSTNSHSSGDTVIIAEEDQTENKMETYEEFEGERRRSCELKDETASENDKKEEQGCYQGDTNALCVSEVCTAEV